MKSNKNHFMAVAVFRLINLGQLSKLKLLCRIIIYIMETHLIFKINNNLDNLILDIVKLKCQPGFV